MKFRARIGDPVACLRFQRTVATLGKLVRARQCRLRITPAALHFADLEASSEVRVWSELPAAALFDDVTLTSQHPENEVLLTLSLEALARALKSASAATRIGIRLRKRNEMGYLALTIESAAPSGRTRVVVQEVPVNFTASAAELGLVVPPPLPAADVRVYLPGLKGLRPVVDRMRCLGELVTLGANGLGEMVLRVETAVVSVKTYFRDLEVAEGSGGEFAEAAVVIRSLHTFLAAHPSPPDTVLLSISQNSAITLHVLADEANITFFVPAHLE